MKKRIAMTCAMFLAGVSVSRASMDECKDQTQMGMNICAKNDLEAADASLKATYQTLFGKYDGEQQKLLATDQAAWRNYRSSHCNFMSFGVKGVSAYPMVLAMCLEDMAREREKMLASVMDCDEVDLGCSRPQP